MPTELVTIPLFSRVRIVGDVEAVVTAICWRDHGLHYEVSYWSGSQLCSVWVEGPLVQFDGTHETRKVGF